MRLSMLVQKKPYETQNPPGFAGLLKRFFWTLLLVQSIYQKYGLNLEKLQQKWMISTVVSSIDTQV